MHASGSGFGRVFTANGGVGEGSAVGSGLIGSGLWVVGAADSWAGVVAGAETGGTTGMPSLTGTALTTFKAAG
ncbi:MAG: hypothetical protein EB072_12995 [Betaproteobacteria bacterium]|nr:hypothetical protein [Betaproteobacteria bacterium]